MDLQDLTGHALHVKTYAFIYLAISFPVFADCQIIVQE